jgi:hypothetical protein
MGRAKHEGAVAERLARLHRRLAAMSPSVRAEWDEELERNEFFDGEHEIEASVLESFIERRIPHTFVPGEIVVAGVHQCARCGHPAHDAGPPAPGAR